MLVDVLTCFFTDVWHDVIVDGVDWAGGIVGRYLPLLGILRGVRVYVCLCVLFWAFTCRIRYYIRHFIY